MIASLILAVGSDKLFYKWLPQWVANLQGEFDYVIVFVTTMVEVM